jgi:ParB family chromosome partitioning protein
LINIENVEDQLAIFQKVLEEELSVRKVEELVRNFGKQAEALPSTRVKLSQEFNKLQTNLSSHFGTKIQIKSEDNKKGEIKIPFMSVEDLNRILEILNL